MTKAIVVRSLGGPEVLKLEDVALDRFEVEDRPVAVGLTARDVERGAVATSLEEVARGERGEQRVERTGGG